MSSFFDKITGNKTSEKDLEKEQAKLVDAKFSAKSFFKIATAKIGTLSKLNFLILLMLSPLIFTLFGYAGGFFGFQIADTALTPQSALYAQYSGVAAYENSSALSVLSAPFTTLTAINADNALTLALKYIGLLAVLTFGPCNVGCVYVMRSLVREQSAFVWHDFWGAIKRNLRQSLVVGVIDCLLIVAAVYALPFYYANAVSFAMRMLLAATVIITALYFVMRFYIYLMLVTFDLSVIKLFKNAFILSSAGIKRAVAMLAAAAALVLLNVYLFILVKGIGTILPMVITLALLMFTGVYCAYPVMKKYMIDPYYTQESQI